MIRKGQRYKVIQKVNINYGENNTVVFTEGNYYFSPEDDYLTTLDWAGNTIDVRVTPDVADRCFEIDNVSHPTYYNTNNPKIYVKTDTGLEEVTIECIDVIRDMPSWKGNIIKYAWRAGLKEEIGKSSIDKEIEDLEKIKVYTDDRINQLKLKQQYGGL